MRVYYLDSSVAAYDLLPDGNPRVGAWIDGIIDDGGRLVSSRLLRLELARLARREHLDGSLLEEVVARVDLVEIDRRTVDFAETIEPHVNALDALHLATAWLLDPALTVATHDRAMAAAAAEMGLATIDPLAPDPGPDGREPTDGDPE
ncbi:MAG: PIN domain-containing protein [Bifidobacteriaceae bacterium]|nr:PIN domain-containing protein [Bifidobacteriaceae bacterium]